MEVPAKEKPGEDAINRVAEQSHADAVSRQPVAWQRLEMPGDDVERDKLAHCIGELDAPEHRRDVRLTDAVEEKAAKARARGLRDVMKINARTEAANFVIH